MEEVDERDLLGRERCVEHQRRVVVQKGEMSAVPRLDLSSRGTASAPQLFHRSRILSVGNGVTHAQGTDRAYRPNTDFGAIVARSDLRVVPSICIDGTACPLVSIPTFLRETLR
jgi:hypothetical protein